MKKIGRTKSSEGEEAKMGPSEEEPKERSKNDVELRDLVNKIQKFNPKVLVGVRVRVRSEGGVRGEGQRVRVRGNGKG
jgi:hypothetical protein